MRKAVLLLVILFSLSVINLSAFDYKTAQEYKDMNLERATKYIQALEAEYSKWKKAGEMANAAIPEREAEIEELKAKIAALDAEYAALYEEMLALLGVTEEQAEQARKDLAAFNERLNVFKAMSKKELGENRAEFEEFYNEVMAYGEANAMVLKVQDIYYVWTKFIDELEKVKKSLPTKETYTVVKGDCLFKISAKPEIYNDGKKWGRIFRANRDKIKNPNLIYPGQVFLIPRGLPNNWTVYKGECLWKIASYWEIYDNPTLWPRIYEANKDQIKDPDIIHPNQVLKIPRN